MSLDLTSWPDNPGIRLIAHRLYRRDQLCPGPSACEYSTHFVCADCLLVFEADDVRPRCPACRSVRVAAEQCDQCGQHRLDEMMAAWKGRLIVRASDFLFAGRTHVPIGEPTLVEFRVMQILEEERVKFEIERMKDERERASMNKRRGTANSDDGDGY